MASIRRNIALGGVAGVGLAGVFSAYVVLLYLWQGSAPFEELGASLGLVVLTYFSAGVIGGIVVGLMLVGAAAVGYLAAWVLWSLVSFSTSSPASILSALKGSAGLAAAFGVPIGAGMWFQVRRFRRTGRWK